ncbi:META and DUF4377 domain-containing protein [Lysobacter ciconiae]|uniref:META and DUF4377 domain-containing protein n=1 Tax=Novilysobacter ciconiae TaxID=2781022 RepID=A0A7S6UEW9_9GAMM|nr:META and DUF4377 domain-containing protein [Lysobacter ciconiae]QOW19030.1 META and DUF4377 domain-containing protein [Lysobacter ciconiae]
MKFHLLLLPLALAACTAERPATPATDTPVPAAAQKTPVAASMVLDAATLGRYHWQLAEASDAYGAHIDALFARDDKPVQLDFADQRLSISNTCNLMNGGYRLDDDKLKIDSLQQTLMACADPKLAELDRAVSSRFEGSPRIRLTGSEEAPRLELTSEAGDKLVFAGEPTAASRYGGEGEQVFMEVAAQTVPCSHPLIPDKQCLQVRERTYRDDGTVAGEPGEWEPLYQEIEGYTHEAGVRNVLRLKRYQVANPPADGSSVAYVLDMVVESEQVAP